MGLLSEKNLTQIINFPIIQYPNSCLYYDAFTPLMLSVENSWNYPLFILLLENGANPNIYFPLQRSFPDIQTSSIPGLYYLLYSFCRDSDNIRYVEALLDYGADINFVDNHGNTALHLLMMDYSINLNSRETIFREMIVFLLSHGADEAIKNNDGKTALQVAYRGEQYNILFEEISSTR